MQLRRIELMRRSHSTGLGMTALDGMNKNDFGLFIRDRRVILLKRTACEKNVYFRDRR